MDCRIVILEQPAEKFKFRRGVHGHRNELLIGKNSSEEGRTFPLVEVISDSQSQGSASRIRESLREDLFIRMSLVDIRSRPTRILEHYHQLVYCNGSFPSLLRSITKKLKQNENDDRVEFDNLGIFKTPEKEKENEVTERKIKRKEEEVGSILNNWDKTNLKDQAIHELKETSPYRLKLMFEAFIYGENGEVVKVAPEVFSDEIVDLGNLHLMGGLPVGRISISSGKVTGGTDMMIFLGDKNHKVSHKGSIFQAEFFEINPQDHDKNRKEWYHVVDIRDHELHKVGQSLGGLFFLTPPYKDPNVTAPVDVLFQLIKRNKNKTDQIQSKSDPLTFTYTPQPRILQRAKRPKWQEILGKHEAVYGSQPRAVPFKSSFNPNNPPIIQRAGAPPTSEHQHGSASLLQTIEEIRDNPMLLPSHYPGKPHSSINPFLNYPINPSTHSLMTMNHFIHPTMPMTHSVNSSIPVNSSKHPSMPMNPSTHPAMSMNNHSTHSSMSVTPPTHTSALSMLPSTPLLMPRNSSSPVSMSMNSFTPSSPSMNYLTPSSPSMNSLASSSYSMNSCTNSSNTLLVDIHGLGSAPSSSTNFQQKAIMENSPIYPINHQQNSPNLTDILEVITNQQCDGGIQNNFENCDEFHL